MESVHVRIVRTIKYNNEKKYTLNNDYESHWSIPYNFNILNELLDDIAFSHKVY